MTALIRQRNAAKKSENTIGRFKEILAILDKYDYAEGITPQIVVSILQDLGPTFVKIGQIASQQSENIPTEYVDALATLRSSVEPMDIETVHAQIEKHLGTTADEAFASFDETPLGSASIGQVHKATLGDGTVVAVKVRRPGIVDTVARDFALIEKAIDFNMSLLKNKLGGLDVTVMVKELENTSKLELDFTNEANNLVRFYDNNVGREGVRCPRCYTEFTNEAILVEDFAVGKEASDSSFLAALGDAERERLASLVAENFATQVLVDGFYHADPHSGNVLIQPVATTQREEAEGDERRPAESPKNGIAWIDFGMMGTLTARERQTLLDLVGAVLKHDAYGLKRTVLQVATPQGEIDHGTTLEMCESICDQSNGTDLDDFSLGDLIGMVLSNLRDENYRIEPFLTNLSRGIIAVEGTVRSLCPSVNVLNAFFEKANVGFDPKNLNLEEALTTVLAKLLRGADGNAELPGKAVEVLDMLEKGQLTIRTSQSVDHASMSQITGLAKHCIRAAMAIALLIGACILCVMPDPGVSRVIGIPSMGFVCFLLAIILMIYVLRGIGKD